MRAEILYAMHSQELEELKESFKSSSSPQIPPKWRIEETKYTSASWNNLDTTYDRVDYLPESEVKAKLRERVDGVGYNKEGENKYKFILTRAEDFNDIDVVWHLRYGKEITLQYLE